MKILITLLLLTLNVCAVELRGYGNVEATWAPEGVRFRCEDAKKAQIFASKLLKDWQGCSAARPTVQPFVGQHSADVYVLLKPHPNADQIEPTPYPNYLDYYDLKALKFYAAPMDSLNGMGVETHWPFAHQMGIEGLVFHGIDFAHTKGPGVFSFVPWDFGVKMAESAGGMITLSPSFAGMMPEWVREKWPDQVAKVQAHTLVTEWIQGVEGMPFDSDRAEAPNLAALAFEKQVIERYKDSPALGGWQFYCGKPIGDQLGRGMGGILWEASTTNDLVDIIGGDWDEERWDLGKLDWYWSNDEGNKWVPAPPPPSNRRNFLEQGRAWYRVKLPQCKWLEQNKNKELYLRAVVHLMDGREMKVDVNGVASKSDGGGVLGMIGAKIPANTFRNDGNDVMTIEMPDGRSGGRFAGPVSLSPNAPQNYPYSDEKTNARYIANIRAQNEKIIERNERVFLAARAIDPVRPMSISGADMPLMSRFAPTWGKCGFAMQSTSTDGFYWPFLPDLGRLYGFYFIGEPSRDVAAEDRFDRNFGTIFYTGASSTAVFMDIEQYMKFEAECGGMSARTNITRLVGKYLIDQPNIALYASTLSDLCGTSTMYLWNLARGEAQAVHYDTTMVTECALADGLVAPEQYPLMFCCGADVMNEKMVADIEKYVRNGGTFIASGETGRHTATLRDAHPFARLSGFKTHDFEGGNTSVKFTNGETTLPLWAGKEFNANGYGKYTAMNWHFNRMLDKVADDAEVLAVWQPSGKPAAGVRKLGRGRIITLASGFWREAADIKGKWVPSQYNELTDQLFKQLGAQRNANASSHHIWTRKATSKNGTEDWLIAFNIALDAKQEPIATKAELAFRTAQKPLRVFDAFTQKDVQWHYEEGWVKIGETEFGPYKTRIFAATRPVNAVEATKVWWDEKLKYHTVGDKNITKPQLTKLPADNIPSSIITFDEWEFSTNQVTWRKTGNLTWKLQFPELKDYQGKATYRTTFKLAKHAPYSLRFNTKTIYEQADIFVNGAKICHFNQANVHSELTGDTAVDITKHLIYNGQNEVRVEVTGGQRFTAGVCDQIWLKEETEFAEALDLCGEWQAIMKDFITAKPCTVPSKTFCRYLKKTINVPKSWRGKRIALRIEQAEHGIACVVINGRARNLPGAGHVPFANLETIVVSDLIHAGEENTIELWHRHTIPVDWKGKGWNWPLESNINLKSVTLGIVK